MVCTAVKCTSVVVGGGGGKGVVSLGSSELYNYYI